MKKTNAKNSNVRSRGPGSNPGRGGSADQAKPQPVHPKAAARKGEDLGAPDGEPRGRKAPTGGKAQAPTGSRAAGEGQPEAGQGAAALDPGRKPAQGKAQRGGGEAEPVDVPRVTPAKRKDGKPSKSEIKAARQKLLPEVRAEILESLPKPRTLLEQLQWEADHDMVDGLPDELVITDRPTSYNRERFITLCREVASGRHLAAVCRDDGMPSYMTVTRWGDASPSIALALARAYESCAAVWEGEMLPIADYGGNDTYEGPNGTRTNTDVIQRSKLRIETREKLLKVISGNRWREKVLLMAEGVQVGSMKARKPYTEMTSAELAAEIASLQGAGPDPEA